MRYPLKVLYNPQQEELIMSRQKAHHTKPFKVDAINDRKEHPYLTQVECAKNLGIGVSTLARWEAPFRDNGGDIPVIGSGNYASEEEKEIAQCIIISIVSNNQINASIYQPFKKQLLRKKSSERSFVIHTNTLFPITLPDLFRTLYP